MQIVQYILSFRLGGDEGSMLISWKTLNPVTLIRQMGAFAKYFDLNAFEEYMKRVSELLYTKASVCFFGKHLVFFPYFLPLAPHPDEDIFFVWGPRVKKSVGGEGKKRMDFGAGAAREKNRQIPSL